MDLMQLDIELISNLKIYAEKIEEKVEKLQRIVQEIRQPLEAARGKEEEYLGNPLHSFPLIRHMYQDWKYLEEFMKKPVGEEQIDFLKKKLPELPWQADIEEATRAMFGIAETYGMRPWEMAQGLIDNVQFKSTLTALDCFQIAKMYFKWGYFKNAYQWLGYTKSRMTEQYSDVYEVLGVTQKDVALLQTRCLMELGQVDEAHKLLLAQPDLAENATILLAQFDSFPYKANDMSPNLPDYFKELCRSSFSPKPSRLHCRYNTINSPFLILAPLKMEEISLEPYIVVYHGILPDKDIEELKRLAEPKLKPTYAFRNDEGTRIRGRTALGVTLPYENMDPTGGPLLDHLTQRIRDITGLKIRDRHPVNLFKYGFGAHYGSQYDYYNTTKSETEFLGDRIATVFFYLNDDPQDGDTIFPYLNMKVPAERGKVIFWYNLNEETHKVRQSTFHEACPVFNGSKWAMAAWIQERDQMFIQPISGKKNLSFV
ncbi:prolyl 4-hydroxylase subunit alpha-1 [Drosophila rhopaloa]|uniref:Prolyl 4-hydroxylase alpha subunit domain-containing protein n=1 Tax=Drosophila rhopaloa TaxID=1041015 RepID=A0ABM5H8Q1_DRORH|nr:prolyl 4-hydroxylase subunit alpha-1 [Drosophila rhopaloa]